MSRQVIQMVRIFNDRVKGILTVLFAGAIIAAGNSFGLPEVASIYIGIGVAAAIDVGFRLCNRDCDQPFSDPEAGGTFWHMPVWFCCVLCAALVAALYSGLLK
jgi:hypothetical protein